MFVSSVNEKSAQRKRKHRVLVVVRRSQKFRPVADPLPGSVGQPKFTQHQYQWFKYQNLTTFTYKPSLARIDARNLELSW